MFKPIPIKRSDQFYSNYWVGYSLKLMREVDFFGDLQYEYWLQVETDPDISEFCERPIIIDGVLEGKRKKTQFDMYLKKRDGKKTLVKILYSSKQDSPLRALEKLYCEKNGFEYICISELDIRQNPIALSNRKQIITTLCNRKQPIDIDLRKLLHEVTSKRTSIKQIIENMNASISLPRTKEALFWLIYKGDISSNMYEKKLSLETEVWLNDQTKDN
ncbi:MAG: hypothetical protein LPK00_10995 [Bacillaceae bacterium]|nr:hypothetical protein [Bacillaceae bacterium]